MTEYENQSQRERIRFVTGFIGAAIYPILYIIAENLFDHHPAMLGTGVFVVAFILGSIAANSNEKGWQKQFNSKSKS